MRLSATPWAMHWIHELGAVDDRPRVLFVAHSGEVSGPTHSLLLLLRYLRERYDTAVLLPEVGPLHELVEGVGSAGGRAR